MLPLRLRFVVEGVTLASLNRWRRQRGGAEPPHAVGQCVHTVCPGVPVPVCSVTTLPSTRILQVMLPCPWALSTKTCPPKAVNSDDQGRLTPTTRAG